jgi:hypothetical protein
MCHGSRAAISAAVLSAVSASAAGPATRRARGVGAVENRVKTLASAEYAPLVDRMRADRPSSSRSISSWAGGGGGHVCVLGKYVASN